LRKKVNVTRFLRFIFSLFGFVSSLFHTHLSRISLFGFRVLPALLALFLFLGTFPADAAQQNSSEAPKTPAIATPAASAVIPVEEVAMQATQVGDLIRGFAANLAPSSQVEAIRKFLSQASLDIALELKSTMSILKNQPALETLQAQEQIWQERQSQLTGWLNVLTARATKLQVALAQLKKLQDTWSRTRDAEVAANAPAPILEQIDATLAAIQAAQKPHQAQRDEVLELQGKIAEQVAACNTTLQQIDALRQTAVGGMFTPENPPVWRADLWARAKATVPERLPKLVNAYWENILVYVTDPSRRMPQHIVVFIALSLILLAARRQIESEATGNRSPYCDAVFDHVFAGALLVTLMVATAPTSPVPEKVKELFWITALVPIVVLTRRAVPPNVIPAIYALAILFVVDTLRRAITGEPPAGQGLLILEAVAGIAVLVWLLIRGAHRAARGFGPTNTFWRAAAAFLIFDLSIGLVAAVFGYVRLARLAVPGVLAGAALALELYASVQVAMGIVAYAFRVWPLRFLHMIEHHRNLLERRIYMLFLWGITLGWLARYLDYLGLLNPAQDLMTEFLNTRLERGSISITVGDIVAFFLTVLAAYLLSAFIRFVLEEDVYPRTRIVTGQSYALSSILNYAILAIGFVVALGVLGMDLTKMTVLASAFGVGLGFGMQSVVNNFVSGLILLFERPIHVGDTVQVGNLQGRVRRIGIRASIVRTQQGAEIIVPNAQLITEQVTNWTLSDQLRRVDLPVGVNYGAAARKVIELLEGVARAHPKVLQDPAPRCLFMSYGDSSINFELRAWTEYSNSQQVHSDLTVAIYDAVYAAGMTFPFAQREVRMLSDHDATSEVSPAAVEKKKA
jgi:potassium-dependent mechanosensitive channel